MKRRFDFSLRKSLSKTLSTVLGLAMVLSISAAAFTPTNIKAVEADKKFVMYYGDWSVWGGQGNFTPDQMPLNKYTHINYAFLDFDANGNLVFTDNDAAMLVPGGIPGVSYGEGGLLKSFKRLKAMNPNLKYGISVGGWTRSGDFSVVAGNATKRANLVSNLVKFLDYNNMDFIDIDWEYPGTVREPDKVDNSGDEGTPNGGPMDKVNYIALLSEIKAALNKKGAENNKQYEVSVAISAAPSTLNLGVDVKKLFETVDFVNVMSYDLRGAWDNTTGHQTPLYRNAKDPVNAGFSIDESVKFLLNNGAVSNKIVVGAAYYTRGWGKTTAGTGTDSNNPGLFAKAEISGVDADNASTFGAANDNPTKTGEGGRRGGVWAYRNLALLKQSDPGLVEYWDDVAKSPYLYSSKTGAFYTYDNKRSVTEKANYVNANNLGGMIVWQAAQDAPVSTTKREELSNTIYSALFGSKTLPDNPNVGSKVLNITAKTTYYDTGSEKGYTITVKNNETASESGLLEAVEKQAETAFYPVFEITTNKDEVIKVDAGATYAGRRIEQGQTYEFNCKVASKDVKITKIELKSAYAKGDTPYASQVIFEGSGEVTDPDPEEETTSQAWNATAVYQGGAIVTHNGSTWQAKYWTQGNEPQVTEFDWQCPWTLVK